MDCAHVSCAACGGRVGWTFVRDRSAALVNLAQEGRYGLVVSSLQMNGEPPTEAGGEWGGLEDDDDNDNDDDDDDDYDGHEVVAI